MTPDGGKSYGSLTKIISPYLVIEGVTTAALVSTDGLLVTVAGGEEIDMQALAAHSASALAVINVLAEELGGPPRILSLEVSRQGLILAPLTKEVFLALAGDPAILSLARA